MSPFHTPLPSYLLTRPRLGKCALRDDLHRVDTHGVDTCDFVAMSKSSLGVRGELRGGGDERRTTHDNAETTDAR